MCFIILREWKLTAIIVTPSHPQLTFCAVIRNISRNATNISYTMEDGTGEVEVRQWLDSTSDDSGKAADIQ
jgi:replication factor A2